MPSCFRLERQLVLRAFSRARANTGKRIAAKMAIIAITTSSSIKVKPISFVSWRDSFPTAPQLGAAPFALDYRYAVGPNPHDAACSAPAALLHLVHPISVAASAGFA